MKKCRCIIGHPKNKAEREQIQRCLVQAIKIKDKTGIDIMTLQLATNCETLGDYIKAAR